MTKKVLIVGYFWPYRGGSARMLGLATYLAEFGWEPTILTAPLLRPVDRPIHAAVVETPYAGDVFSLWRRLFSALGYDRSRSITEQIKQNVGGGQRGRAAARLRTLYLEMFAYPDTERRWIAPAFSAGLELAESGNFDAILSVWPVSSHVIARRIKRVTHVPWVADFPDPWSQNHAYPYGRVRRFFDRWLEQRVVAEADAVTAATPGYARSQSSVSHRDCEPILLGFEPDQLNEPPAPLSKKFTVSYTGTIYDGMQDPLTVLDGIQLVVATEGVDRERVEVRFFGENQEWLRAEIEQRRLEGVVVQGGRISRTDSLARQRESQVLLLLGWEDHANPGVIPYKTFEYLAAQRPILIVGGAPDQDIVKIVKDRQAGWFAATATDVAAQLLTSYREYVDVGSVQSRTTVSDVKQFSYREMAKRFSAVLDAVSPSAG